MAETYIVNLTNARYPGYIFHKQEQIIDLSFKDCILRIKSQKYPEFLLIFSQKKQFDSVVDFLSYISRCISSIKNFAIYLIIEDADFSSFYRVGKYPYIQLPESRTLFAMVKLAFMLGVDAIDSSIDSLRQYGYNIQRFYKSVQRLDLMYKSVGSLENLEMAVDYLTVLAELIECFDNYPVDHIRKTARLAYDVALCYGYSEQEAKEIARAVKLHDVGKLFIPKELLGSRVIVHNEEDMSIFYEHTKRGAVFVKDFLRRYITTVDHAGYLNKILAIVKHHHENYDGSGYPARLKNSEIPFEARLVRILDMFDSLTRKRSYRTEKLSTSEALEAVREYRGRYFDPEIVRALEDVLRRGNNRPGKEVYDEVHVDLFNYMPYN